MKRVVAVFRKTARPKAAGESPTYKETTFANTLNTFDIGGGARVSELVVEEWSDEELSDLVMYRGQRDETEPFRSRNECKCTNVHAEHNRSSCGDV